MECVRDFFFFFHPNDQLPSGWLQLLLGTMLALPVLEQSGPEGLGAFFSRRLKDGCLLAPQLRCSSKVLALLTLLFNSQAYLFYDKTCSNQ